jgi:hypothetical protein
LVVGVLSVALFGAMRLTSFFAIWRRADSFDHDNHFSDVFNSLFPWEICWCKPLRSELWLFRMGGRTIFTGIAATRITIENNGSLVPTGTGTRYLPESCGKNS